MDEKRKYSAERTEKNRRMEIDKQIAIALGWTDIEGDIGYDHWAYDGDDENLEQGEWLAEWYKGILPGKPHPYLRAIPGYCSNVQASIGELKGKDVRIELDMKSDFATIVDFSGSLERDYSGTAVGDGGIAEALAFALLAWAKAVQP